MKVFKWYTWVLAELFYGYADMNCLNKLGVETECKLEPSAGRCLWQLEGAHGSLALRGSTARTLGRDGSAERTRVSKETAL